MKTKNKYLVSIIALVILTSLMISVSAATKVFFFHQAKGTGTYTLAADYKAFGARLDEMGYDVEVLGTGLSTEALNTYNVDILVVTPLSADLTPDEMTALYQFVMDGGKGVFIMGGTASANKITTPMGMRVVEDPLEDEANQVIDKGSGLRITDKTTFSIDLPTTREDLAVKTITQGVNTVNVFGVSGIYVFGQAKGVVFAGDTANSPKSLNFPKGSNPPVAAYVKLGRGMVFFLSDPDMLANKYIDSAKYRNDNLKLGVNAVDWLSTPSTDDVPYDQMEEIVKSLTVEKMNMNRTIEGHIKSEKDLTTQLSAQKTTNQDLTDTLTSCQTTKFMGVDYLILAILGAGAIVAVSLFFAMSKKKGGKKSKKGSGELGYEFDNKSSAGGEFSEGEAKIDGEVKEEDIEERLKELEKKSSDQQA